MNSTFIPNLLRKVNDTAKGNPSVGIFISIPQEIFAINFVVTRIKLTESQKVPFSDFISECVGDSVRDMKPIVIGLRNRRILSLEELDYAIDLVPMVSTVPSFRMKKTPSGGLSCYDSPFRRSFLLRLYSSIDFYQERRARGL